MIHIPPEYTTPHSLGHERDVVAVLLNYPETFDEYPHLTPEHFHAVDTKAAFTMARDFKDRNVTQSGQLDWTGFLEQAIAKGKLESMGGASGLAELSGRPAFPRNLPAHVEKLNHYLGRRLAIAAGLEMVRSAFESEDVADLLETASAPVTAIHEAVSAARPPMNTKTIIAECFEGYKARLEGKESPMGIPTIAEIDIYIRGLHPGRVIVIGAYTGGGKSVLSSQILTGVAISGIPALEINYEMKEKDSMDRKLIQDSGVPSLAFMDPHEFARVNDMPPKSTAFLQRLAKTANALAAAPIRIVRPSNRQLRTLLATIRKAHREMGARVVSIDYLQLIRFKAESKESEISEISHSIQELAQELNISVLLLSQLNTDGNTKHGVVAMEDCDAYLIIENEQDKKAENFGQHYQILLAKERHNGNSGRSIPLIFNPDKVRFDHGFNVRPRKQTGPQKKK